MRLSGYADHMIQMPNSMHLPESTHNTAQEARQAADDEVKRVADVPSVHGGETWGNASGHSGTHAAWFVTGVILAGFVLGGVGLTFGPRVLLWCGVAVVVLAGAYGAVTRAWSDYRVVRETDPADEGDGPESAHSGTAGRPS